MKLMDLLVHTYHTANCQHTESVEVVAEALGCTAEDSEPAAEAMSPSAAHAEQPAEREAAAAAPTSLTPQQPRITVEVAAAAQAAPAAAAEEQAPAAAPAAAEAPPMAAQHKGDDTCVVCSKDAGKKVLVGSHAHDALASCSSVKIDSFIDDNRR